MASSLKRENGPLTAYSSYDQDLLGVTVSHGAFCDLHQHREECLLQIREFRYVK